MWRDGIHGRATFVLQPSERLADTRMSILLAEMAELKATVAEIADVKKLLATILRPRERVPPQTGLMTHKRLGRHNRDCKSLSCTLL